MVKLRKNPSPAFFHAARRSRTPQTLVFTLYSLNEGKARPISARLLKEGQLKERSEGDQAQWQTALGEELAAGS
jgi:hypothetical protein